MDVLIIKKKPDVKIEKNIGQIFRIHNIVEFKSETDTLTKWDYNKAIAYALLYSSFNKVPLQDITVTFAVECFDGGRIVYQGDYNIPVIGVALLADNN